MRRLPGEKDGLVRARFVNEDAKVPRVNEKSVLTALANGLRVERGSLGCGAGSEARIGWLDDAR